MNMLIVSQIYFSLSQLSLDPVGCSLHLCSCSFLMLLCYGVPNSHLGSCKQEATAPKESSLININMRINIYKSKYRILGFSSGTSLMQWRSAPGQTIVSPPPPPLQKTRALASFQIAPEK